jgi:hypothetical protein
MARNIIEAMIDLASADELARIEAQTFLESADCRDWMYALGLAHCDPLSADLGLLRKATYSAHSGRQGHSLDLKIRAELVDAGLLDEMAGAL